MDAHGQEAGKRYKEPTNSSFDILYLRANPLFKSENSNNLLSYPKKNIRKGYILLSTKLMKDYH